MKARLLKKFEEEVAQLNQELKIELPKEIKRARELGDLKSIVWVNPSEDTARLSEWLKHKIRARNEWRLTPEE